LKIYREVDKKILPWQPVISSKVTGHKVKYRYDGSLEQKIDSFHSPSK
jgi:hypothetical protein